jgi:hypothetical protein
MRWVGHVACRGVVYTRFWWGDLREDYVEDLDIDGRIIF